MTYRSLPLHRSSTSFVRGLCAILGVTLLYVAGCNAVVTKAVVGNQSGTIESALKEGKAVLIAKKTIYEPSVGSTELIEMAGELRPPLTY